jgi:ATP-binding cassette subfamily C protein
MLLVSVTEGIGIFMLVPFLEAAGSGTQTPVVSRLDDLLGSFGMDATIGTILIIFVILVFLRAMLMHWQQVASRTYNLVAIGRLRQQSFAALLNARWRWHATQRSSDHANILMNTVGRIGTGLDQALALMVGLASLFAYSIVALLLSWQVTLVAFGFGLLVLMAFAGHRKRAVELGHDLATATREMQASVQEGLAGLRLTKIFRQEELHLGAFMGVVALLREKQLRFVASSSEARMLLQMGGALMLAALLYAGLSWWSVPVSRLLALSLVFARLIPMLGTIQQNVQYILYAGPALAEYDAVMLESQTAAEPARTDSVEPIALTTAIELRNVSLTYANRDQAALDDVSIQIPARKTTAIIGHSGSGKSSLADVLTGLIEADHGSLWVDDAEITESRRRQWLGSVAYVQQDAFLFHDTVRGNLTWANPQVSEADMFAALELASAQFVFAMPKGLDTIVGDGGMRLSGGERQRIALARALLERPALLILDEATSALDPVSEAEVQAAIAALHGNLTIVIIGHRLALLEKADQIIEIRNGTIWEQTTLDTPDKGGLSVA